MQRLSQSQQAGVEAVRDEAVFLGGQLLVGGSSLVLLKRLNWRTSGYVLCSLSVQAVAFQTYCAFERGMRVHFQRAISGCQKVVLPPSRSFSLRLMSSEELMSTYSTHLSHPSLPLLLDHQQNSPNNLQAQTDSTQESRKNLVPKEAYLKDSVRGVMPIDPNLYHCLAPIYDRVDVDKSRVGAALYLAGQHVEQCLVPPLEPLKSLVVLEAETDTKCTDQRQCNKADVLNNATKLRDRIVERYGGSVEAIPVVIDWSTNKDDTSLQNEIMGDSIVSHGDDHSIVIKGNYFILGRVSHWLREMEAADMNAMAIEKTTCHNTGRGDDVILLEDNVDVVGKEKKVGGPMKIIDESSTAIKTPTDNTSEEVENTVEVVQAEVLDVELCDGAEPDVKVGVIATVCEVNQVEQQVLNQEESTVTEVEVIQTEDNVDVKVLEIVDWNKEIEAGQQDLEVLEEELDVALEHVTEDDEYHLASLMLSFFEWTGESIRTSTEEAVSLLGRQIIDTGSLVSRGAVQGYNAVAGASGSILSYVRRTSLLFDISILFSKGADHIENKFDAEKGFKKTDLWIVATGNDKVDDYNLTGFVESLLKATKKQYNVRVVSPASVPFLDSSRNTSQNIDVKNARVVIVGGNNASSGETEIKLAEICAACGCQVLLLTSDDSSQSANTSERVCVVNVPKIREDIFLFSRMLLEESFKKDNSSTALMTAEAKRKIIDTVKDII